MSRVMRFLNVGGGGNRTIPEFEGWEQDLLDIDPACQPDILLDARELCTLEPDRYDAVYCSHNLEHYVRHEVPGVLGGFLHVLKPGGFAQIVVPDLGALVAAFTDLDDVWYQASSPITFHDVLYGWGEAMANGNPFYAHRCGFTEKSLGNLLRSLFIRVRIQRDGYNLRAIAHKCR